ncbi:MAG TPA: kynureninase [Chryseosolibacter sp.]|nr:kynureninase [Chryseosolibacter sp.]
MQFENSRAFARKLDIDDPLKGYRERFYLPSFDGKPAIYFTGNSLGLQAKSVRKLIEEELEDWARLGVEGHVQARRPWIDYHHFAKDALAHIVGAKPIEVVAMNHLTVNLHLLLVSFFRPTSKRYKILTESGAFSSDQYVLESQLKFHGLNPDDALIELKPREGEAYLRTEDIVNTIERHGKELALVFFGGVQYYTGQFFDVPAITSAGHKAGAIVGFDLAHAVGNVVLHLHDDDVDFAAWCSYKYLNSGPGAIGGAFVHERHAKQFDSPRFAGWWGHDEDQRFKMEKGFRPMAGVDGWQLSNHPILAGAAHLAALEIIVEAGMPNLRKKSEWLTGYLEFILDETDANHNFVQLLTPRSPSERGCQLSLFMKRDGRKIFQLITQSGVIADWREPNVIRVAPVPLYNTFEEVYNFGEIFAKSLKDQALTL